MEICNSMPLTDNSILCDFSLSSINQSFSNSFSMSIKQNPQNPSYFHSQLSNNSLISLSVGEGIKAEAIIDNAHDKRINEIFADENVIYSCSNDCSVKMWDMNSNKLIKAFKKTPEEIYTISKSKHILAGGCSGKIVFWDLKVMKERFTFADSHADEVTKLEFHPDFTTLLLAGSLDGILCLFDLAKENEEDAIEAMIREKQPIDYCGFGASKEWAYIVSTVGTVNLVNLAESTVEFCVNVIENNESNQCYLIECEKDASSKDIIYYRGNHSGCVEEFKLEKNGNPRAKMTFANSKYVRCCKTVKNDIKIIGSEDGLISLVKAHEIIQNEYDDELKEKDIFMEEEKNEEDLHKKKKFKNDNHKFDPFRK